MPKHESIPSERALAKLQADVAAESSDGAKLVQNPVDNPICTLSYDDSLRSVVIVWKGYATSRQLRLVHEHILRLVRQHGATRLLGDDTYLGVVHSDDQRWITTEWMPRAIAAGIKAGASKTPSAYFAKVSVANIFSLAPSGFMLRSFQQLADARRWLLTT